MTKHDTLIQDLRIDAEMLRDGFQKNLTELWHSDVVQDAAKNAMAAADRIQELEEAIRLTRRALKEEMAHLTDSLEGVCAPLPPSERKTT